MIGKLSFIKNVVLYTFVQEIMASYRGSLLVVEDSNADFRLIKRLMRKMDVQNPIYRCKTGDEALELMYQKSEEQAIGLEHHPEIILLDLNLPGTDGRAVLAKLKQDQVLKKIPIVVFTCSSASNDIAFCYAQGANGYMVKPVGLSDLTKTLQAFVDYWLGSNTSPFFVMS